MRSLLLIPIFLAVACAIGVIACHVMGIDPHLKELIAAMITCLIAGGGATVPMLLARHADQGVVSQAALVGTIVQLFASIGIASVAVMGHVPLGPAFLYWLLGLYWITLIGLVIAFIRCVRSAPPMSAVNKAAIHEAQ